MREVNDWRREQVTSSSYERDEVHRRCHFSSKPGRRWVVAARELISARNPFVRSDAVNSWDRCVIVYAATYGYATYAGT